MCRKDKENDEIYQKTVRVSLDNRYVATGGTDGHIRVWGLPEMYKIQDINAHPKEVDDIDFKPNGKHVN